MNGSLSDDPIDGDDDTGHTLPGHHGLSVLPRQHPRETVVAGLLHCKSEGGEGEEGDEGQWRVETYVGDNSPPEPSPTTATDSRVR